MAEKKGREPKPGLKQITPATALTLAALFLAGCSTKQEILASLDPPQINTGQDVYYTKSKNPVLWFAFSNTNSLTLKMSPEGKAKAERDSLNHPTGKVKLTLPEKNTVYTLEMTARNCDQPNSFNPICSDEIVQSLKIVRDNIPPNARIINVMAFNGGLKINYVIDDALSRPPDYEQFVFFDTPRLGKNTTKVTFSDMAGNNRSQILEGNYDPFTSAVVIDIAEYDKVSKKILISGTIDNSGANLTALGLAGTQESFPFTYLNTVDCADPAYPESHQGKYRFIASCTPTRDNGKVIISFTLEDVWGNKFEEQIKVTMPGLNKTNEVGFYAFWAAAFLSSGYMVAGMRRNAYRFKRRGELKQAIAGGDPDQIGDAYSRLTKRDKREFQNPVPFLRGIKKAEFCLYQNNFADCLRILERLFKHDAELVKENRNNLLIRTMNKINGILAKRSLISLNDHQIKPLIAFLFEKVGAEDFEFLWKSVEQTLPENNNILPALTIYLMQKQKPQQEERQERAILRKKALKLGLFDLNVLRERLPALLEFGDYQSLVEFFKDIDHMYRGKENKSQVLQLRERVASAETAQYNNLKALLQRARDELNPEQQEATYEEVRESLNKVRLISSHQEEIKAEIKSFEQEKTIREIIQGEYKAITDLAVDSRVPPKGIMVKKIDEVLSYLNEPEIIERLKKENPVQVRYLIKAMFAVGIIPVSCFLGAEKISFENNRFIAEGFENINVAQLAKAFHQEGLDYKNGNKLESILKDFIWIIFSTRIIKKIVKLDSKKNGGNRLDCGKISLMDAEQYRSKSYQFFQQYLQNVGIELKPGKPGCFTIINWFNDALFKEKA